MLKHLRGGVPGVPVNLGGEVSVSVVHADGVNLLFVTFDTVGGTNVVSENPGLCLGLGSSQCEGSTACEQGSANQR